MGVPFCSACLSCYFQLFSTKFSYASRLGDLGHYYRQYRRLMDHWQASPDLPLMTVAYEDMVGRQEETTRAMIDFCDLPWNDSCLRFHEGGRGVATPSFDDVRQPIYDTSLSRWKNYERHLQPLIDTLGEFAARSDQ